VLRGRRSECDALDRLLDRARVGQSATLLVLGEAGVGKTALLEHLRGRATDCLVLRAAGVQSEMELAFAGLHQLCAPLLDRLQRLPGAQRRALETAFGLSAGTAPDRFLVGLAALGLLAEGSRERPVVCLVDDAQWLDRVSAQALAFIARRVSAEPVALVFAARPPADALAELPVLSVEGLERPDARALLDSVLPGPLDERVRDRIVAETRGIPLALLELPRGRSPALLAGGFGTLDAPALSRHIEESFGRRLAALPAPTRMLLLVAAAEPLGDPALLWRATEWLGLRREAAAPASAAALIEIDTGVRFRHPLVRSAVYRTAPLSERRRAHQALAEATDPALDPGRRAWHRAHAASGPDEELAAELERSAGQAEARGGLAAGAAFLERASRLTPDPARRGRRALAAAAARIQAGTLDEALDLLAVAADGPLDERGRAQLALLQSQVAFASDRGGAAPKLLLDAAERLEPLDPALARETYLSALSAAVFASRFGREISLEDVARAARAAPPPPHAPRAGDVLLDGLAMLYTEGFVAAVGVLRRAVRAFRTEVLPAAEALRLLWLACSVAALLWDDESWQKLSAAHVRIARESGALGELPIALSSRIHVHLFAGELATASDLVDELEAVTAAVATRLSPYGPLGLAAWRGHDDEVDPLVQAATKDAVSRGEGIGVTVAQWASALRYNGQGRYAEALSAATSASDFPQDWGASTIWAVVELIEAAARTGKTETAAHALERLTEVTQTAGTDWALGVQARSQALLSDGADAEALYRVAIERLGRTRSRLDLARAHLLYGEWLRRKGRRMDAREQLRIADELFARAGAETFAERARRERLATGETVRKRTVQTRDDLTPQERQIARRARDGQANAEIGAELFLSPRTVEWHLRNVFTKLGIRSRRQLPAALSEATGEAANG
jgi:DNA-binding CsgD family transcriptional regulator